MEHGPFTDDFPNKTSIYNGFSIAMLNYQRVTHIQIVSSCSGWIRNLAGRPEPLCYVRRYDSPIGLHPMDPTKKICKGT